MTLDRNQENGRNTAIIVGILFLLAIVTLFLGQALYNPYFDSVDYLELVYPNRGAVVVGVLIELIGVLGLVLIPVLLFPILRKHSEALARGYVSFRLFEAVLLTIAQTCKLLLINLSQDYLASSGADAAGLQYTANAVKSFLSWNDSEGMIYLVVFISGALLLYSALYKSRIVPAWISIWGIVAAVALLMATVITSFDLLPVSIAFALMMILPLQEVTMSIWFIAKGFNQPEASSNFAT